MKIALIAVVALAVSPCSADQIYKCTTPDGDISFQQKPCASAQEQAETLEIDNKPEPGYVPRTYPQYTAPAPVQEDPAKTRKEIVDQFKRRQAAIDAEYDQRRCERYKGYLEDAKSDWDYKRTQGYTDSQKYYYERRIEKARREMEIECR